MNNSGIFTFNGGGDVAADDDGDDFGRDVEGGARWWGLVNDVAWLLLPNNTLDGPRLSLWITVWPKRRRRTAE